MNLPMSLATTLIIEIKRPIELARKNSGRITTGNQREDNLGKSILKVSGEIILSKNMPIIFIKRIIEKLAN